MSNWITHNLKLRSNTNKLPFITELHFSKFSPKSFAEEAKNVCIELSNKYSDLYLAFSGGSDSLYIANLFLELKLPIKLVIVSCPYNQLDILPAFEYCKKHSIDPIILNYGSEYLQIVKDKIYSKGLMSAIGLTPLLVYEHVKNIGGKVVSGQGEPLPITNRGTTTSIDKIIQLYEFEFYMDVYAIDEQPSPFYCYNQSIFYSYMKEIDNTLDLQEAKCKLYGLKYKPKTYWSEEIYENIRQNNDLSVQFFDKYDCNNLLEKLEQYIV
jgi:hypothetical protein